MLSEAQARKARKFQQEFGGDEQGMTRENTNSPDDEDFERADFDQNFQTKSLKATTPQVSQSQKFIGGFRKYGITVPQPFDFDIRDRSRSKSIRERKIEQMVEQHR